MLSRLVSEHTAAEMEKSGFEVPGVSFADLRAQGAMADDIDVVIRDVEIILARLKQANTIIDGKAYEYLRRTNDRMKSEAKFDASIRERFAPLLSYFSSGRRGGGSPEGTP